MGHLATSIVVLSVVGLSAAAPQILPVRHVWKDLETWTRYNETTRTTEVGLGLQPGGPTGAVAMAFTANFPGRTPAPPATEVTALVSMGYLASPNVIRNAVLTFLLDEGLSKWTALDLSPRFVGDELPPTTNLRSGLARMTPEEYQRVTRARAVKVNVMGTEVTLSRAQLDAMRAYARRVVPGAK
jgi:hypothetical protein